MAQTLTHVNAMPAPTWGWLKMNETTLEIPEGLQPAGAVAVEVELEGAHPGDADAFAAALARLKAATRHLRRASAPGDAADRARLADADEALDVPALSSYQTWAVATEESYAPEQAFETGMGEDAYRYLCEMAGAIRVFEAPAGEQARVTVYVAGAAEAVAAASTDVVAHAGSELTVVISLDAPAEGTGIVGSALRLVAEAGARVDVVCVQTAGDGYIALDDSGFFVADDARVNVRHVVLGAGRSLTGLASELAGDRARMEVDTSYLGAREQQRDFNYELRHRGRDTHSDLSANGVLAGASEKILRGTIDLVHGCKGSTGSENETVLLADERVKNKTVPIILCDEDDVAGNHGATIGHVRPDQLFYLMCRGISTEAAEGLFIRAKLEDAWLAAPNERVRAGIERLGGALFDDFEEEIA